MDKALGVKLVLPSTILIVVNRKVQVTVLYILSINVVIRFHKY